MTDSISLAMETRNHTKPCPLASPTNWVWVEGDEPEDGEWIVADGVRCTCTPSEIPDAMPLAAPAAWSTPSDQVFDLSEITARRGGISFIDPLGLKDLDADQLRARVTNQTQTIRELSAEITKLRKKNRRLLRLIGRII